MDERNENLSWAEFARRAIKELREFPKKGIHSEYSGFKEAFRKYFDKDPESAIDRLESEGVIETREAEGGLMLYLEGEAPVTDPDEAVSNIIGAGDEETPNFSDSSEDAPPVVIDQQGVHETTEYALVASEDRVWLRNFREGKERLSIKSVYLSKEDIKAMDREKTQWQWDGDEKVWAVDTESVDYMIDHFLTRDYEIALSPEISEYVIEKLDFSVDRIEREPKPESKKEDEEYGSEEVSEGKPAEEVEDDRVEEHVESPGVDEVTSPVENSGTERHGDEIKEDDIVEHDSGQRGKVVEKDNGTLVVNIGPDETLEWSEAACEFIREGT